MQLEEYKVVLRSRFDALQDEEKRMIGELGTMPVGEVLFKVLGPELTGQMAGQEPQQQEQPQEQIQPRRMGLGSR